MRKIALLLVTFWIGVAVAACGGQHGTRAPHLPPPNQSTATTGIVQGHEKTTTAGTTAP